LFIPAQVRQITKYDKRAKKLKSFTYARFRPVIATFFAVASAQR
jgi:hypothetical protein